MENFRNVLVDCQLRELNVVGGKFTWSRGKNMDVIMEMLDRRVATDKWLDLFPFACERHIVAIVSDHVPMIFQISECQQLSSKVRCSFKFENMWLEDKGWSQTVAASWAGASTRSEEHTSELQSLV